jgi:hypothetical protein
MNSRPVINALIILFIACIIFVCGCTSTTPAPVSNSLPSDKFVTIYEEYHDEGTVVEGNGTVVYVPVPCPVPMPFDNDLINGYAQQYQSTHTNFKIFYGTYYFRYYPYSGYTTAYYRAINEFPATLESNLTILDVDKNGTINASYMNQSVMLKIGDKWQSPIQTRIKNESLQVGNDSYFSGVYQPFVVRYNTSWSVENKGLFDK